MTDYDLNECKLRDIRYDLVLHLSTAADGANKFYTCENNKARHENLAFALELDKNL